METFVAWLILGAAYLFLLVPALFSEMVGDHLSYFDCLKGGLMLHLVFACIAWAILAALWSISVLF